MKTVRFNYLFFNRRNSSSSRVILKYYVYDLITSVLSAFSNKIDDFFVRPLIESLLPTTCMSPVNPGIFYGRKLSNIQRNSTNQSSFVYTKITIYNSIITSLVSKIHLNYFLTSNSIMFSKWIINTSILNTARNERNIKILIAIHCCIWSFRDQSTMNINDYYSFVEIHLEVNHPFSLLENY